MSNIHIHINQLRLSPHIGIHPWERQWPQIVSADARLTLDSTPKNDDIGHTCDYTQIAEYMQTICKKRHYNLVETLVKTLAEALLKQFPLSKVELTLLKPNALPNAKGVGVSITLAKTTLP